MDLVLKGLRGLRQRENERHVIGSDTNLPWAEGLARASRAAATLLFPESPAEGGWAMHSGPPPCTRPLFRLSSQPQAPHFSQPWETPPPLPVGSQVLPAQEWPTVPGLGGKPGLQRGTEGPAWAPAAPLSPPVLGGQLASPQDLKPKAGPAQEGGLQAGAQNRLQGEGPHGEGPPG